MFWIMVCLVIAIWLVFYAVPKGVILWEICQPLLVCGAVISVLFLLGTILSTIPVASPPPPPAVVSEFSLATYEPGLFTTACTLKNDSKAVLFDVNLDLVFQREDGETLSLKRFWSRWDVDEIKTFPVSNGAYEKMSVHGTANRWGKSVTIDVSWFMKRKAS